MDRVADNYSPPFAKLLDAMLNSQPHKRKRATELEDLLNEFDDHPEIDLEHHER
jgi:hypothetical protein